MGSDQGMSSCVTCPARNLGQQEFLTWLAEEVSPTVREHHAQYYHSQSHRIPELARAITPEEYASVVEIVERLGWKRLLQEMGADSNYPPI